MSNKEMADKLAALRKQAVRDDPHKSKGRKDEKKTKTPARTAEPVIAGSRERTAVVLTPDAVGALRTIHAFLITDCGAKTASASAAICVALQIAADGIEKKRGAIAELYEKNRQSDGRRKSS